MENVRIELNDEIRKNDHTKKIQSTKQAQKDKPETKVGNNLGSFTKTQVAYEVSNKASNVKFLGCINKIWIAHKGAEDYRIKADARDTIAYFIYNFIVDVSKTLKIFLDADQKLTFKPVHFLRLLQTWNTMLHVDVLGFSGNIKNEIEQAKREKDKKKEKPSE